MEKQAIFRMPCHGVSSNRNARIVSWVVALVFCCFLIKLSHTHSILAFDEFDGRIEGVLFGLFCVCWFCGLGHFLGGCWFFIFLFFLYSLLFLKLFKFQHMICQQA